MQLDEGKNYGKLYHSTTLVNLAQILRTCTLRAGMKKDQNGKIVVDRDNNPIMHKEINPYQFSVDKNGNQVAVHPEMCYISLTRDYHKFLNRQSRYEDILMIDGAKLSDRYKIVPYNYIGIYFDDLQVSGLYRYAVLTDQEKSHIQEVKRNRLRARNGAKRRIKQEIKRGVDFTKEEISDILDEVGQKFTTEFHVSNYSYRVELSLYGSFDIDEHCYNILLDLMNSSKGKFTNVEEIDRTEDEDIWDNTISEDGKILINKVKINAQNCGPKLKQLEQEDARYIFYFLANKTKFKEDEERIYLVSPDKVVDISASLMGVILDKQYENAYDAVTPDACEGFNFTEDAPEEVRLEKALQIIKYQIQKRNISLQFIRIVPESFAARKGREQAQRQEQMEAAIIKYFQENNSDEFVTPKQISDATNYTPHEILKPLKHLAAEGILDSKLYHNNKRYKLSSQLV